MDGNSNSTTLIDHQPKFRHAERAQHGTFLGPADIDGLDYTWSDGQRDTSHTSHSPLGVVGFIRLGGLNRASTRKRGKHRGAADQADHASVPPTRVTPPLVHLKTVVTATLENGPAGELAAVSAAPIAPAVAIAASEQETPGFALEVGRNTACAATNENLASELNRSPDAGPSPATEQDPFQRLQELSQRVKAGDDSAMAEIRRILDGNDALWRQLGDIEKTTEAWLIEVADGSAASKESVRRSVAAMKQSLLGVQPTPLERMAIGRVVACWLFAHFVDRFCSLSIKQGCRASDLAKLLEASEKRYCTALKSLKLAQEIRSPSS